ncbi:hypothetical protein QZH41_010977, partial [Actinostola sp. cb2023]
KPMATMRRTLSGTVYTTYNMFHEKNMSVKDISKSRNLVEGTVFGHLAEAIVSGYPVDYRRAGVTDDIQKQVTQEIRSPPINSDISKLSMIKERLPSHITYGHMKLVIAIVERQYKTTAETQSKRPCTNSETPYQGTKRKVPDWLSLTSHAKSDSKVKKKNPF